jgi:predicted nucleic-acid-binding protein
VKRYRLDTNILVRFFTHDDPDQFAKINTLFADAEAGHSLLVTSKAVLVETVWVLLKVYAQPRAIIAESLTRLISEPAIVCEDHGVVLNALRDFQDSNLSIVDCLLAAEAAAAGDTVATFDADLRKKFLHIQFWELGDG